MGLEQLGDRLCSGHVDGDVAGLESMGPERCLQRGAIRWDKVMERVLDVFDLVDSDLDVHVLKRGVDEVGNVSGFVFIVAKIEDFDILHWWRPI